MLDVVVVVAAVVVDKSSTFSNEFSTYRAEESFVPESSAYCRGFDNDGTIDRATHASSKSLKEPFESNGDIGVEGLLGYVSSWSVSKRPERRTFMQSCLILGESASVTWGTTPPMALP